MMKFTQALFMLLVLSILAFSGIAQTSAQIKNMKTVNFETAAKRNSVLMNILRWQWGKQQTGWSLYVPLMKETMKIESEPGSAEFAQEVAEWQKSKGMAQTGEVDKDTLFSFINHWQSRRIKPVYEAKQTDLLDAPITDFFDETRSVLLLKVDKSAYQAYKTLFEAAIKEIGGENPESSETAKFLKIISSYRSPEYQAELRNREPGLNRAQLAFKSPHFTGRALDIYVGGDLVSTKDENRALQIETAAYLWLVKNAEKFGFYPYFYEPWHWEFVGN